MMPREYNLTGQKIILLITTALQMPVSAPAWLLQAK